MNVDLHHQVNVEKALEIQLINTDTTTAGEVIDTLGYNGIEFAMQSGDIADGTYTPRMVHDDQLSMATATEVPAAFRVGTYDGVTFNTANTNLSRRIGYVGKKRFVRLDFISTSTSTGGTLGGSAVKYQASEVPTGPDEQVVIP